jgi:aminoglycoside 2''-phosphotransferase
MRRRRVSEQRARRAIERAFPDLVVREIAFLGAGVDSEAYLVNGEWVFRFPKRAAVARALAREIALLPRLAPWLPVAIPRFQYVGRQGGTGRLFAGYRLIPGEPLTPERFDALAPDEQERVLATLAEVLSGVHGFPVAEAAALGVESLCTREWVAAAWAAGRAAALALLGDRDGAALVRLLERFLGDQRNFAYTPCLLYADFAPEHILYDPTARALTGLIDWGDLALGDPDFDLLYLYQDHGAAFVRRLLAHYPHPDPARLPAKLRVFNASDYLQDIAAAEANDATRTAAREAVAALRALVRED